jgi:hypothetical protein
MMAYIKLIDDVGILVARTTAKQSKCAECGDTMAIDHSRCVECRKVYCAGCLAFGHDCEV